MRVRRLFREGAALSDVDWGKKVNQIGLLDSSILDMDLGVAKSLASG